MVLNTAIDNDLTYSIIGILYKVHNKLGPYHKERTYQNAIETELQNLHIPYQREQFVKIIYNGKSIGKYFLDFVIAGKVLLETKTLLEQNVYG